MHGPGYDDTVGGWHNLARIVGHCRIDEVVPNSANAFAP